jgi:hypothetical protein
MSDYLAALSKKNYLDRYSEAYDATEPCPTVPEKKKE